MSSFITRVSCHPSHVPHSLVTHCGIILRALVPPRHVSSSSCRTLILIRIHSSQRAYVSRYGDVVKATVVMNAQTGKSKGFGFAEFAQTKDAQHAQQVRQEATHTHINMHNTTHHITSHHTTPHHITPHHTTPHHTTRTTPHHNTALHHTILSLVSHSCCACHNSDACVT